MKNYLQKTLFLVLTVFLTGFSGLVKAQWNTNTSVNETISGLSVGDMQSASTSDGKLWVAFYHDVAGSYEMRAQLFDAEGNKLLGVDGLLVSNQPSGTATYVFNVCVDASNNLIIACQDQRIADMQAVVYKISQSGTQLWGANGIVLGGGLAPNPAVLTNGEVVVVWNESISNTLKIQKITTSGTLGWATPVTVLVGSTTTTRGQIAANLNNKFTMVYQKNAGGISTNLYAQQYDNTGAALYAPLQIGNQTTAGYRYYSIASEGDTTYFGYYSSVGFRFNSFLQRINPGGSIPWGMNGSNFNTSVGGSDNYQGETRIKIQPGSNYVWSVCTFSDINQTIYGVYIQKFLKTTGARQFTDQGKVVYPISANRDTQAGELSLINDTPMFMSYTGTYKIFATRLDASGNFAWPHTRTEISSTTYGAGSPKGRFGFEAISTSRCAGIWTENRGAAELGYAQGISAGGLLGVDVATQGSVPATITTGGGTLQMTAVVYPAVANQAVTWSIVPGTGIALISASGLVTAITDGTAWAKATAVQDVTVKDSLLITMSGQVPVAPSVVTLPASGITLNSAALNGTVNANNFSSSATFQWGLTVAYGNTATATPSTITGNTSIPVAATISGLASGTTYHFRCVGNNAAGTTNGLDLTFTTQCVLAGSIGVISGPNSVCATSTGNVYSVPVFAGATSYIWTVPAGATITAGNNTRSITVTYAGNAQSGNFTVYATDGTCISTVTPPFAVTVSPVPVQAGNITGNQSVCEGDQGVQYSVDPIPGVTTYIWTLPSGVTITSGLNTNSITVNFAPGTASGSITVYGTNSCGTGAASNPLPVDVSPLPGTPGAISGPNTICAEANNVVYSVAPVTNAYGYVWTLPPGAVAVSGANTNQVTVHYLATATSGNVKVSGTNGNCLGQVSAPLTVVVNPTPTTPVITQHVDTLISSADAGNQWYLGGVLIPGANGKKHLAIYGGYYTVVVTLNGCSSPVSNSILVLPVSVKDNMFSVSLQVYPNPTNGKFDIKAESGHSIQCTLEIYNYLGAVVWKQDDFKVDGAMLIPVDMQDFPSGTYTLLVRSNDNSISRKIIITK
ncbi:MAG: T9SS type A sorting domain-containing protein [Bacteroidota bacterium]